MILYTIMPEHLIFPTDETQFDKRRMVTYNGVSMMVEQGEYNQYVVVQVISSDPQHFLEYEPGQKVWLNY
ncbi:YlzJ-like family protein [Bacillus sp. 165]|uniref:YlzJ-like family protein n=1 Tax=Bacillus sp. 165 TaxID=1529117 RepID=UPI001ADC9722|nr:YlzJ-like family protein [Bacillus sp. 165]MBO9128881.1 YlzJ-like family protein [Bacillus sp. 165]